MSRIYHNPRCSKSRGALALLEERGESPEVVRYLERPPALEELDEICELLGIEPVELVRTGERRFRELGLGVDDDRDRRGWLEVLVANPILIERPIVVRDGRAVIARPPERVLDLF